MRDLSALHLKSAKKNPSNQAHTFMRSCVKPIEDYDESLTNRQVCIPVGCIPPTVVAWRGGKGEVSVRGSLSGGLFDRDHTLSRVYKMTHTSKNITVLQTSFASG